MATDLLLTPLMSLLRLAIAVLSVGALGWGTAIPVHAQPDLGTFIREQIVQQDIRLADDDEAAAYLRARDPGELRIIRNALFAQHGYVFDDSTLQNYFDEQDWYEAEDKEVSLSATEKKNVEFIQSLEDRARSQLESFYEKFPPCDFPARVRLVEGADRGIGAYSRNGKTPSIPGSGEPLDSLSVEVLLHRSASGLQYAGCTIAQTDRYRTVLYVYDFASGAGISGYVTARFDAAGRLRSKRNLLEFSGNRVSDNWGELTISRDEEILIEIKQVNNDFRRARGDEFRKVKQVTTWSWFTIGPDGALEPLREDR